MAVPAAGRRRGHGGGGGGTSTVVHPMPMPGLCGQWVIAWECPGRVTGCGDTGCFFDNFFGGRGAGVERRAGLCQDGGGRFQG